MLTITVSIRTTRYELDGATNLRSMGLVSMSHRLGFARQYYDGKQRENVTKGLTYGRNARTRQVSGAIRGQPEPPADGRLPDAWLPERGGRRRAGSLASAQPLG